MPIINNTLIQKAISVAHTSTMKFSRHGAIMFDKKKIRAVGANSSNRTCIGGMITPSIHAEMQCLVNGFKQCSLREWKGPSKKV